MICQQPSNKSSSCSNEGPHFIADYPKGRRQPRLQSECEWFLRDRDLCPRFIYLTDMLFKGPAAALRVWISPLFVTVTARLLLKTRAEREIPMMAEPTPDWGNWRLPEPDVFPLPLRFRAKTSSWWIFLSPWELTDRWEIYGKKIHDIIGFPFGIPYWSSLHIWKQ